MIANIAQNMAEWYVPQNLVFENCVHDWFGDMIEWYVMQNLVFENFVNGLMVGILGLLQAF